MRKSRSLAHCRLLTSVAVATAVSIFTLLFGNPLTLSATARLDLGSHVLQCVQISTYGQSREGLGALFRRNQLAFFTAETYGARISFPAIESEHGYEVADMFDKCPTPPDQCVLSQEEIVLNRCPRADCDCHRSNLLPFTRDLAKKCRSILVNNDVTRTMEYSGCFGNIATRYLGSNAKEPVEFDAIHIRTGDLAHNSGGKAFGDMEVYFLLGAICRLSKRDIIIVTEGQPKFPVVEHCKDRLVLAGDTELLDAFRIFQHAKHVAAGQSSFAGVMMEIAKPTRMITLHRTANFFEWVDVENWTIVGKYGALFHFDSKEMMVNTCLTGKDLVQRSFKTINQFGRIKASLKFEVPMRKWTNDSRWVLNKKR